MIKLCFALVFLVVQLHGQFVPNYTFSKQEALDLVNQLFKACNPDIPENAYMPTFLREKLRWVYREKLTGRLGTEFVYDVKHEFGAVLMMSSYYENGTPFIRIIADRLIMLVRVEQGVKTGFNRTQKNYFALSLAHEATHLERPISSFREKGSRAEFIREELRVYRKMDVVVTELMKEGEPIDSDYAEMHKVLMKCGKSIACPAFTEHYSQNPGNTLLPK